MTLFFPEQRPFFLENAGFFSVGNPGEVDLFFSRRIGVGDAGQSIPILGGGRVAGKAGKFNVGWLNMQTSDCHDTVASTNFGVMRVSRVSREDRHAGVDDGGYACNLRSQARRDVDDPFPSQGFINIQELRPHATFRGLWGLDDFQETGFLHLDNHWQFFTQALVQYNDRADLWSANFRFGWLQAANTGLFVVCTDTRGLYACSNAPNGRIAR